MSMLATRIATQTKKRKKFRYTLRLNLKSKLAGAGLTIWISASMIEKLKKVLPIPEKCSQGGEGRDPRITAPLTTCCPIN